MRGFPINTKNTSIIQLASPVVFVRYPENFTAKSSKFWTFAFL